MRIPLAGLRGASSLKSTRTTRWRRNEPRPKVHVGSACATRMEEWKPLDIATDEPQSEQRPQPTNEGLQTDAPTLQANFEASANHLEEVRLRHTEVLVTAGMLPETGLAEQHPERALAWVVNGINGRMNPDGLTIPLLGAEENAIQLHVKETEEATLVKLDVQDPEGPNLVREFPLPTEAAGSLSADFSHGRLTLRW